MRQLAVGVASAAGLCFIIYGITETASADSLTANENQAHAAAKWTGLYAGAGAGYGSLVGDKYVEVLGGLWEDTSKIDREAGYFTATIGYDYQFADRFVIGGFAEYDSSNASNADLTQYSVGGRLGYLLTNRTLLFVSAGYSKMDIADQDLADVGYPTLGSLANGPVELPTAKGFFFGGGAEMMLSDHITLRGEFRHTVFDEEFVALPNVWIVDLDDIATAKVKPESDIFRLTLNYRF